MSIPDSLAPEGATRIARKIEAWWNHGGFSDVTAWVERLNMHGDQSHGPVCSVRSNLDGRALPASATPTDAIRTMRINRMIRERQHG